MFDLLLKIQAASIDLPASMLVIPGLIIFALGVFLWLGGARFATFVTGTVGAMIGVGIGLWAHTIIDQDILFTVGGAALFFAIIGFIFERVIIILIAGVIFALGGGTTYVTVAMNEAGGWESMVDTQFAKKVQDELNYDSAASAVALGLINRDEPIDPDDPDATVDTDTSGLALAKNKIIHALKTVGSIVVRAASKNLPMTLFCTLACALIGLLLAYKLKQFMMAVSCSVVGSAAVILGAFTVMLSKQDAEYNLLTSLDNNPQFMPILFCGMVFVGCIMQLILSRKPKKPQESEDD
jgi:hypothetical protein